MKQVHSLSRFFLGLLLLVASGGLGYAQHTNKLAELEASDPAGFILTLTAVLVVFVALLLLVFFFRGIGSLYQRIEKKEDPSTQAQAGYTKLVSKPDEKLHAEALVAVSLALAQHTRQDEVAIAIALALHSYANQHDTESFVLTFGERKSTQWNARHQGMRRYYN